MDFFLQRSGNIDFHAFSAIFRCPWPPSSPASVTLLGKLEGGGHLHLQCSALVCEAISSIDKATMNIFLLGFELTHIIKGYLNVGLYQLGVMAMSTIDLLELRDYRNVIHNLIQMFKLMGIN